MEYTITSNDKECDIHKQLSGKINHDTLVRQDMFDDMEPEEKISVMESFFSEQRMLGCAAIESLLKHEKELLQRIGEIDV